MAEFAGDDRERLRRLTERLDDAAQRAERLLAQSVLSAAAAPAQDAPGSTDQERPPPAGWQQPRAEQARSRWLDSDELELLLAVAAGVRDRIPPELRRRLADAVRELLMALRAVIDWYLERSERPTSTGGAVEDIPIL